MKKLLPLTLMVFFIISLLGYYPVFLFMKHEARHEMKRLIKAGLPEDKLTRFVFDTQTYNELDWVENGEFRLNGEMFDVVSQVPDEFGNTVIYCINDKKETAIFSRLDEAVNGFLGKSQTAKGRPDVLKILSIYFLAAPNYKWGIFVKSKLIRYGHFFSANCVISDVLSPPPEI
jgi:hypothetical protein